MIKLVNKNKLKSYLTGIILFFSITALLVLRSIKLNKFKKHLRPLGVAIIILLFLLGQFFSTPQIAQAATYTFSQSSWAGGVSGATLTHPTNSTTNYASASNLVLGANSVANIENMV